MTSTTCNCTESHRIFEFKAGTRSAFAGSESYLDRYVETNDPVLMHAQAMKVSSDVHPIFSRAQFPTLSDSEYVHIAPALWLASKYLTSTRSLIFWHAFGYGERRVIKDIYGGEHLSFHRREDCKYHLPSQEKEKIKLQLEILAEAITFGFGHMTATAATFPLDKFDPNHEGIKTYIQLQNAVLSDPLKSIPLQSQVQNPLIYLPIAETLLHELAHALCMAHKGYDHANQRTREEFFEDDEGCEIGYAYQKFLTGGHYEVPSLGPKLEVYLTDLPSIQHLQRQIGYTQEGYTRQIAPRKKLYPVDTHWEVPMEWVRMLFLESFWCVTAPGSNGMAMRPPRTKQIHRPAEEQLLTEQGAAIADDEEL